MLLLGLLVSSTALAQDATLKHSYTFDDATATDVVGGAHARAHGGFFKEGKYVTTQEGQHLVLPAEQIAINTYKGLTLEAFIQTNKENDEISMLSFFGATQGWHGSDYIYQTVQHRKRSKSVISTNSPINQPWKTETTALCNELKDGKKHHVVTTFDNNALKLYIDGVLASTQTTDDHTHNRIENLSNASAYLAKGGYSYDKTWKGAFDAFNIYDGVLSAEQILEKAKNYLPNLDLAAVAKQVKTEDLFISRSGALEQPVTDKAVFFAELMPTETDGDRIFDQMLVFGDKQIESWDDVAAMLKLSFEADFLAVADGSKEAHNSSSRVAADMEHVYQCWIEVDVPANTYTVYAKNLRMSAPILIYEGARFRNNASSLTHWSLVSNRVNDELLMGTLAEVAQTGDYPEGYVASQELDFRIATDEIPDGAEVIDHPTHGAKFGSYELRKLVLTDSTTELYFHIRSRRRNWNIISSQKTIRVDGSDKTLQIKGSEGIDLDVRHHTASYGFNEYKLIFPAVPEDAEFIDYGQVGKPGEWYIANISLGRAKAAEKKGLAGHWHNAETGDWELSILDDQVIYACKLWSMDAVPTGKKGVLKLDNEGHTLELPYTLKKGILRLGKGKQTIELTKKAKYSKLPGVQNPTGFTEPIFKSDTAIFRGLLYGYTPQARNKTGTLYVNNYLIGRQESHLVDPNEDGYFEVKIPLTNPTTPFMRMNVGNARFVLSPGQESFMLADLTGMGNNKFMGANARLSTELSNPAFDIISYDYSMVHSDTEYMNAEEYKKYILDLKDQDLQELNALYQSGVMSDFTYEYKLAELHTKYTDEVLRFKYRKSFQSPENKAITSAPSYYQFIGNETLEGQTVFATGEFSGFINSLKFSPLLRKPSKGQHNLLTVLELFGSEISKEDLTLLTEEQRILTEEFRQAKINFNQTDGQALGGFYQANRELWKEASAENNSMPDILKYIQTHKKDLTSEEKEIIKKALEHYQSPEVQPVLDFYQKNESKLADIKTQYATEKRIRYLLNQADTRAKSALDLPHLNMKLVNDIMFSQDLLNLIVEELTPLPPHVLEYVCNRVSNPNIAAYISECNQHTLDKIEKNKSNTGFNVHNAPKSKADELLKEMLEPFAGKVMYLDFWATWCGPCRSAMKNQKPMKEQLLKEGKDVVFIYITNPTSPETAYNNMIADIKGEHYRLTQDQWNYLSDQYQINGIPHYMIVNKKGEIVDANAPRDPKTLLAKFEELITEE